MPRRRRVLYAIAGLRFTADMNSFDLLCALLALLWCLGCLAGLLAIGRLGVAGRGLSGRLALVVALAGFGLTERHPASVLAFLRLACALSCRRFLRRAEAS